MSANQQTVCVPGPLHPDLFDGETPIMQSVSGPRVYAVQVECVVHEKDRRRVEVAASSQEEATHTAMMLAEEDTFGDEVEAVGVDEVETLDRAPSKNELEAWKARREAQA